MNIPLGAAIFWTSYLNCPPPKSDYPEGVDSFARAMRSFGDVASQTILGDLVSQEQNLVLRLLLALSQLNKKLRNINEQIRYQQNCKLKYVLLD